MIKVEISRGFGKINAGYMLLAAAVYGIFADDIPAQIGNYVLIAGDFLTRLQGHPMPQDFVLTPIDHPPFWQPAILFTIGLLGCMFGTYHDWRRIRESTTSKMPVAKPTKKAP